MAGALKGITVEIGGDTTKLGKALAEVDKKSKSLQSELKGVNTLLKVDPSNVTLLTQKQELLTKAISNTKEKLKTLKDAQSQAQEQFEKGEITEEQYRDLQREIVVTEQKLDKLTDEFKDFGSVGAQQVAQVGEKVTEVGGKVEKFGKGVSVVSAGTGAILAGSLASFVELDEGYDTIITKTGATGEALDDLNTVANNIFSDMPTDMATIGTAVGEVNTRFGYTGEELEKLSRQFIQFAEINGVDLNNSIGTVDKVLEQFNLDGSEAGNVLDLITLKAQQTGIGADTLMNSIQQNGATFKDMGIGVNEAVVLLSQFEANGVNVEVALKGLKKASVEYAKEGVSMEKGLAKTIDRIKNAKTETEALAEVEKLFGAKGANEMVKAIRENRLSVDDLSIALEQYGGTVTDTFEATLDPIDQGKVAMNNLKLAGSELGGVLQSTFAPMLTSLVEKLKNLATWFSNLSPAMQKTITITLVATTALGPLIIAVGKLITATGTILQTAPKIATAFNGLKTAIVAHPYVALAVAIGAIVVAIGSYIASTNKATSETAKAYKEIDEFNKKSREQKKAYDEMVQARKESSQGIEAEFGYYKNLTDELSNIVDENGKVKKGYEDRANTITGILSKALGEEISLDQIVADGKQKVIDKINELLSVKRAEAQLASYEQSYTEAIQKSNSALNEYTQAEANHKKIADNLTQAKKNLAGAQKQYDDATDPRTKSQYKAHLESVQRTVDDLTKKEKEASQTVKDKQDTYLGYVSTIQNYEGVTSAIIEGDSAKINNALNLLINDFITAENGTKASLEKQVSNAKTTLANLKTALENGSPGVTQTMVDNAQDMVNKAEAELKKLETKGAESGKKAGNETAKGLKSKEGDVKKSAKDVSDSAKKELDKTKDKGKKAGENAGKATADGIKSKEGDVKNKSKSVADSAGKELDKAKTKGKKAGENAGKATADGIKSKESSVKTSAKNVANSAGKGLDSAKDQAKKAGENASANTAKGITNKKGTVNTAGQTIAKAGVKGISSIKTGESGKNFTRGFAGGITNADAMSSVNSSVGSLASKALSWLRQKIGEASPAKKVKPSGRNFTKGFAVGINDAIGDAEKSIENLADTSLDTLNESVNDNISTIRDSVSSITGAIVGEAESKAKAYETALKKVDALYDVGVYDEKEYYAELTRLRDSYLTVHSDKWLDATKKIYNYQKKSLDDQTKLYNEQKDKVKDFYDDFTDYAQDKLDDLSDAHDTVADKLTDYGDLMQSVTIRAGDEEINYTRLANLDAQNNELREYADLLLQIKNRENVPHEFFALLRDMPVDEGISFAKALLQASDNDFNAYITSWTEKQQLATQISSEFFETEAENVTNDILSTFDTMSEEFLTVGEDSAGQFGAGFMSSLRDILSSIRSSVKRSFTNILSDMNTSTVNVAIKSANVPQMARGGIFDRPTIVQVGEDGKEAIVPLENNTAWIDSLASKLNTRSPNIPVNNEAMLNKLDRIYERLGRLQIVLDSDTLVGETIDKIDAGLANKQLLSARGV